MSEAIGSLSSSRRYSLEGIHLDDDDNDDDDDDADDDDDVNVCVSE